MIGLVRRTVSPSSSSMRRSTPWVLGCCGPMLMIMVWSSVSSTSTSSWETPRRTAPCSRARTSSLVWLRSLISWAPSSVSAVRSVMASPRPGRFFELHRNAADRIVLAQRMALPVVGHEDACEIGMALEDDPEHVVDLALHGLGAGEELEERWQHGVGLGHLGPHPDALAVLHRQQRYRHLEALGRHARREEPVGGEQVVDGGEIRAEAVAVVSEGGDDLDVRVAVDVHDQLAPR